MSQTMIMPAFSTTQISQQVGIWMKESAIDDKQG